MKLYLNAGHSILNSGGWNDQGHKENELNMDLRDAVARHLIGIQIILVPDNLNLRQSIDWINERAAENDIALAIHFNSNRNTRIGGTEAYYYNDREKHLAEIFSRTVSKSLGINNRGARPDNESWVRSLGFLRQLKCDSVIVETCYLSNKADMTKYDPEKAALGFVDAIYEIIPRKVPKEAERAGREADLVKIQEQISIIAKLVEALQEIIKNLFK